MSALAGYRGRYEPLLIPVSDLNEWVDTLVAQTQRIYEALTTKISDFNAFRKYIAEPANLVWSEFVNPSWEEADLIKLRHRIKLLRAYPAWLKGIVCSYHGPDPNLGITCEESEPYFPKRVKDKKGKLSLNIKYTLGSTGIRYKYGRGIAVKAIGYISGMKRIKSDLLQSDVTKTVRWFNPETGQEETRSVTIPHDDFTGDVINVFLPGAARFARPQAIAIITEGLVNAYYAHEAGLSGERDAVINLVNQYLANTVLKQVDTSKYDVKLGLAYLAGENRIVVCTDVYSAGARPTDPSQWFCSELG